MEAILASFLETAIKFLFLLFIAWGGILCGKKFRDHKDAQNIDNALGQNSENN